MAASSAILTFLCSAVLTLMPVSSTDPDTLFHFPDDSPAEWIVVNDGVMGGLSRSEFVASDAAHATFRGEMSLENNGGFASVRGYLPDGIPTDAEAIELRVRGDGRTYQVRLRMGDRFDGIAYRAEFDTEPGAWTVVALPLAGFEPTFRGFRPRNAPPLDLENVRQLGLMVADKKAGPFRLDVEWIRAVE
jgi:hypothetical protein